MAAGWGGALIAAQLGAQSPVRPFDFCGYLYSVIVIETIRTKAAAQFRRRKGNLSSDESSANKAFLGMQLEWAKRCQAVSIRLGSGYLVQLGLERLGNASI